jgi:hypothetical protein
MQSEAAISCKQVRAFLYLVSESASLILFSVYRSTELKRPEYVLGKLGKLARLGATQSLVYAGATLISALNDLLPVIC